MRSVATTGAAAAFAIQSAALAAGALWAGWELHRLFVSMTAATAPAARPGGPGLRVVGGAK